MVESGTTQTSLYWQTLETKTSQSDLVLIHGWGMNGAVWQQSAEILSQHYRVHIVDLPGFGHSHQHSFANLEHLAQQVLAHAPDKATWLGWSLGGLVASHIALHHPERVNGLITVASSPCFAAQKPWRGIQPQVLKAFTSQLVEDFQLTIERFMALQAMGSPSARQDVKILKKAVLSRPIPNQDALLAGLNLLADVDLRQQLNSVAAPTLRLYGRLDGLVPIKVADDVNTLMPASTQHIFQNSSHAPFMTELEGFCQQVIEFRNKH